MDMKLEGRRAVVTGATAGLGRSIALALGAEGCALTVVGRRKTLLEEVAVEAKALGAPDVLTIDCDMMAEDAAQRTADRALAHFGGIDVLVNAMGATGGGSWDIDDERWEASMTLNWTRHRQLTNRIVHSMQKQKWGRIICVTGANESEGYVNTALSAKAAVHAWSKGLSDALAKEGITANCLAPGRLESEQIRRFYTPENMDVFAKKNIPIGRFGHPEELADLAVFLASPRASYITGVVIPVDGGMRRYLY